MNVLVRSALSLALATALTSGLALAAGPSSPQSATDLPQAWPESVGVDSRPLVQLSEWIRKENLDVRSFLVIKDGKLIYERYSKGLSRDHNYELYSITKNVTALAAPRCGRNGVVETGDERWEPPRNRRSDRAGDR